MGQFLVTSVLLLLGTAPAGLFSLLHLPSLGLPQAVPEDQAQQLLRAVPAAAVSCEEPGSGQVPWAVPVAFLMAL